MEALAEARPRPRRERLGREKPDLTFQWEALKDLLPELPPLLLAHYREVDQQEELDPDFANMLFFAATNRYHIATARTRKGQLVGYCAGWVVSKMIDRKVKVLLINAIFLDRLYRRGLVADNFMRMMVELAKEEGCQRWEMAPQGPNRFRMGKWLMQRWGAVESDEPCYWGYMK